MFQSMFMVQLLVKFRFFIQELWERKSLQILYECWRRAYHALLAQLFITLCHMITWVVFLSSECFEILSAAYRWREEDPFIFDDFHFCRSRVIGLDMTENRILTLCRIITWVVFFRMFWNFISILPVKRGGSLSFWSEQSVMFWLWK